MPKEVPPMSERPFYYDLDGRPVDLDTWMMLFEDTPKRIIQKSMVGPITVSTVWIGLDMNWTRVGPPLIFETLAFLPTGEAIEQTMERHPTRSAAIAGHDQVCALIRDTAPDGVDVTVQDVTP